jgi:hypothetical protein
LIEKGELFRIKEKTFWERGCVMSRIDDRATDQAPLLNIDVFCDVKSGPFIFLDLYLGFSKIAQW